MRSLLAYWLLATIGLFPVALAQTEEEPQKTSVSLERPGPLHIAAVQIEPAEIKIAQKFKLTVRVPAQQGISYGLPDVLDLSPFVELSRSKGEETADGKRVQLFHLELTTFEEVGDLTIPGFGLKATVPDGGAVEALAVPESKIKVVSLLEGVEQPQPRDVAAPVSVTVSDYRLLVYLGFVVLWIGLALVLRFWLVRTRMEKRMEALEPPRAAHEIALEKLRRVVDADLLRQGRAQEYFVRVSDAVREYMGNRYGFFALDLTTRELLEELRDRPTPGLEHGRLSGLLEDADQVKFARVQPSDEMSSRSIDGAFELVDKTKLIEDQVSDDPLA